MPRRAAGLTAIKVRTAAAGRYGDGNGLYLLVRAPEARFWVFRYTLSGKMREMGLGPAAGRNAVTLADARDQARRLYDVVRQGRDPLAERAAAAAAAKAEAQRTEIRHRTFQDVALAYIEAHEPSWKNAKHIQQWTNTLKQYVYPVFGQLPVAEISTANVMSVLEPIWRPKPETASRIRGRIETVLDYAKARGWREGENPARWRGHIDHILPARTKIRRVEHHAALPWRDTGAFVAQLRQQDGIAARALEFTILTAARTSEVLNASWAEFDLDQATWTIPAERMKAGREHRVPLSPAAVEVLRGLLPPLDLTARRWVFPGTRPGRPLSTMAMLMLLRRMKRDDLTAHGFRSTFRDWCAESTNYSREVAEAALSHTLEDKVEAAYRRGDLFEKRRRLMDDWAKFCDLTPGETGRIAPIRIAS